MSPAIPMPEPCRSAVKTNMTLLPVTKQGTVLESIANP